MRRGRRNDFIAPDAPSNVRADHDDGDFGPLTRQSFWNDSEQIIDGSAADGRPIITGIQANNLINRAIDIKNMMEGSVAIATNDGSKAVLNTVLAAAVNTNA